MAEDIKENEMQNGSPTLLRGLDAEGNSVVIPTRDLAGLIMSPFYMETLSGLLNPL